MTGRVLSAVRPVWVTAFRDPVRESHLRLGGLSRVERQLARIGVVTLGLLLVSTLFTSLWRRGDLLTVDSAGRVTFLPAGLLPVTLVAFVIAWALLTWGALAAGPLVRIAVAALFLLTNAPFGIPTSIDVGGRFALVHGPDLVRAGYLVPPAVLVLSAGVARLRRTSSLLLPVFRVLCVLGVGALFLGPLWIDVVFQQEGFEGSVQTLVANALTELDGLLLPLVYVAGILVIDFSQDVAEGVAIAVRGAPVRVGRWLLVALLAVKLWIEVVGRWADWTTYVQDRPDSVVRTLVSVALLAVVVGLTTRGRSTAAFEDAKERLLYGSGVALAAVVILTVLVAGAGIVGLTQLRAESANRLVDAFPAVELASYGRPALAAAAVLAGGWLMRRRRTDLDVELGSGLIVIGVWALHAFLLDLAGWGLGFSDRLVDVLVTLGVAAVVALRWRQLDATRIVALAAVTVFAWLAMTRGDWIAVFGGLAGLPAIFIVVVGIAFSLAGDAAFTGESSPRLPQGARALMFVGYLILSVAILHWVEASHATSRAGGAADVSFFYVGIPWGAWLLGRRLLHLEVEEASAAVPLRAR